LNGLSQDYSEPSTMEYRTTRYQTYANTLPQ
jgi:hypothetical protein